MVGSSSPDSAQETVTADMEGRELVLEYQVSQEGGQREKEQKELMKDRRRSKLNIGEGANETEEKEQMKQEREEEKQRRSRRIRWRRSSSEGACVGSVHNFRLENISSATQLPGRKGCPPTQSFT